VIKQIHTQLCLLAGERVVLLEQTGSTPPAPPGGCLVRRLFEVLKNWSRRRQYKGNLTYPSPRFFQHNFTINPKWLFGTLIPSSYFIKDLGVFCSRIGHYQSHHFFQFYPKCKVLPFPSRVHLQKNSALSIGMQNLISLVPFYRYNNFHTPKTSKVISRVHMIKQMLSRYPAPLIGFNIKPCHLH
jgi:hypothetical protein